MGTMREKYINEIFLAHCIAFGFTPFFLGAFDKYGYRAMPTREDIERFRDRRHGETGRLLRRQQKNNQPYLYGGVTSFHPSMNFRLAEYACANGKAGMERINRAFYLSHLAAYQAVGMKGVEVATGAGGKNVMGGLPLWLQVTHAVNHDGSPGFHTHRLSAGNATDAQGVPRVIRNKEVFYAQDRAYNLAFQASFAHHAKTLLGMRHVEFNGTHAVDKTVDPRMWKEIGVGQRQEKILKWMAGRNWDPVRNGTFIPNMATRQKETRQYTLEDRLKDWGPKVEKAIRDQEQRTGRAWDRVPSLGPKQEPEGAAAAVGKQQEAKKPEPMKVEGPKAAKKIDLDAYQQPKAQEAKPQQPQQPQQQPQKPAAAQQQPQPQQPQAPPPPKPDPTKGPEGPDQWVKYRAPRAEQRKENNRRMYEAGLEKTFVQRLRRDVKTRLKTFTLIRASKRLAGRDRHSIRSREGLKQFLFDARKRPRWYARQQASRAIKRNFFKMSPEALATHGKEVFKEARRPAVALRKGDRINVSKAVADTLTTRELNALVRIARKSKAQLFIPGKEADIRRSAARQQQQQRQRYERGQTHFH